MINKTIRIHKISQSHNISIVWGCKTVGVVLVIFLGPLLSTGHYSPGCLPAAVCSLFILSHRTKSSSYLPVFNFELKHLIEYLFQTIKQYLSFRFVQNVVVVFNAY